MDPPARFQSASVLSSFLASVDALGFHLLFFLLFLLILLLEEELLFCGVDIVDDNVFF